MIDISEHVRTMSERPLAPNKLMIGKIVRTKTGLVKSFYNFCLIILKFKENE